MTYTTTKPPALTLLTLTLLIAAVLTTTATAYSCGAELNPTGNPIGGGVNYSDIIDPADADYIVSTKSELLSALADIKDKQGSNHGANTGASWVDGQVNKALYFDGVDDYASVGVDTPDLSSPQGTIAFWMRANASGTKDIINIFEDGYENFLLVRVNANDEIFVLIENNNAAQVLITSAYVVTPMNWHYVAITQNGSGVKIFIDGNESAVTGANSAYWTNHLNLTGAWIGKGHWSKFNGTIDEVTIYDRALTEAEVQQNYVGSMVMPGLSSWWSFDDNPNMTGQIIYVDDNAEIDMGSSTKINIPSGVTLASGRGRNGSLGGKIFTSVSSPGEDFWQVFTVKNAPNVRITGLRFQGPDLEVGDHLYGGGYGLACGIAVYSSHFEADNSELSGFPYAVISLRAGATDAHIHHNYIHHNHRYGLGYGVVLHAQSGEATALIEANLFDFNRHSIAGTRGQINDYEARYNIVLEHACSHAFDMHGGCDKGDPSIIAGRTINIHNNTFALNRLDHLAHISAVSIRGIPQDWAWVANNWAMSSSPSTDIFRQSSCVSPYTNMTVSDNCYGPGTPNNTVLPVAVAVASSICGVAPLNVSFDGTGSYDTDGSIRTYYWDFGDGNTSTGAQANHTFADVGKYNVVLTVTDEKGVVATDSISVTAGPPSGENILSFWVKDSWRIPTSGYYRKQALIDGAVVWEDDVADNEGWQQVVLDVTPHLSGKTAANLTFRVYCDQSVTNYTSLPEDIFVYWDDVYLHGAEVLNGDFESGGSWDYFENHNSWFGNYRSEAVRSGSGAYSIYDSYTPIVSSGSYAQINQEVNIFKPVDFTITKTANVTNATTGETGIRSQLHRRK